MAVTKLSNSGIKTGVLKYDSMLAGNPPFTPASFESISTLTGAGTPSTLTFSGIPSTFQHLQIRGNLLVSATSGVSFGVRLNGDTGTQYRTHYASGNGAGVEAASFTATSIRLVSQSGIGTTSYPAPVIIDIYDYNSTTKKKVVRVLIGQDSNNTGTVAGSIEMSSGAWTASDAITSLSLITLNTTFAANTKIALYGIKGSL